MNHRDEPKQIRQMEKATKQKNKAAQRERTEANPSKAAKFFKSRKLKFAIVSLVTVLVVAFVAYKIVDTIRFNSLSPFEQLVEELEDNINANSGSEYYLHHQVSPNGTRYYVFAHEHFGSFANYATVIYEESYGNTAAKKRIGLEIEYDMLIFGNRTQFSYSTVTKLETKHGTEVIIQIVPPTPDDNGKSLNEAGYEKSEWFGITPSDSLGNVFTALYPPRTDKLISTYPMWFLVLPLDTLPDDYELRYGDFVLTAEDIRSGTWSPDANGN